MNKLVVILCITGLISNVYFGLFSTEGQTWNEVFSGNGNAEGPEPSYISSIIVPNRTIKEIARYDNEMFMEMFWENKTSGNWTKYTLTAQGQIRIKTLPIEEKEDGFGDAHSTVCTDTIISGTFELVVEENDGEPVVVPGSYNAKRDEYTELNEKKVIQIITDGEVSTDAPLAHTNVPLTFNGNMRSYPNPNLPRMETLDEKIYGNGKEIHIGDCGNISKTVDTDWHENWTGYTYHWAAENAVKVAGYDTIMLNITSAFYTGKVPFNEKIWISNETSYPVKVWSYTNTSEDNENYTYYMILETTRTMQYYTPGSSPIPWGAAETHFKQKNPEGEYESWYSNYMPVSGSDFNDSSFDFKQEDAVNYAIQHSSGLKSFMNKYDDVVVSSAVYNLSRDAVQEADGHAGTYWWNLTFSHKPGREEYENDNHWKYSYNIKIEDDIEKQVGGYAEKIGIAEDLGLVNGSSPCDRSELNSSLLTLTSSENLLKQDDDVQENAVNQRTGEIDFCDDGKYDTKYSFVVGGISITALPGLDIVGTLTGISFPTFNCTWVLQKGTLQENGETFSAGVDAETGQLLYVTHIKGTVLKFNF